jgi:hypothetical protein
MAQEQPRTGENAGGLGTSEVLTTAAAEVLIELLENLPVQILHGQTSAISPIHQVFRGPNVAARGNLRVAALKQHLGETFNQIASGTVANRSDSLGCYKELGQHDDLLE